MNRCASGRSGSAKFAQGSMRAPETGIPLWTQPNTRERNKGMSVFNKAHRRLPYHFRKPDLLEEALTHRSHFQGTPSTTDKHNERLEFLGDAVLGLIVSEYLTETFPELAEGELSQIRARLIGQATLVDASRRLDLGQFLRLGRGEERTKGRDKIPSWPTRWKPLLGLSIWMEGWRRHERLCYRCWTPNLENCVRMISRPSGKTIKVNCRNGVNGTRMRCRCIQ